MPGLIEKLPDLERILTLCEEIRRREWSFHWICKTRPDLVSEELIRAMARSGCYMISYGKQDVRTLACILLGSPGESETTIESSIDLVRNHHVDFTLFGELLPDPISEPTLDAIRRSDFTASEVEAFFLDGIPGPFADQTLTGIDRATMIKWILRANRRFYFRPSCLIRRLLDFRNPRDLVNLVRGALMIAVERFRGKREWMFVGS